MPTRRSTAPALLFACALLTTGCHHNAKVAYQPPPPPTSGAHYNPNSTNTTAVASANPDTPAPPTGFFDNTHGKPVYTETGIASWYGPNYHHKAAADGTTFDQNAMTAAHRTLPMGSTVRVTNLATGQQVLVRITDRGPFSPERVLDLSMGAAKAIGVYRAGLAKVKIEAFAHASADPEGHWCVQTGAFKTESQAIHLKTALLKRYHGAKVIEFSGPTGYWVRIDPAERDKKHADEVAGWIGTPNPESQAYLVRID